MMLNMPDLPAVEDEYPPDEAAVSHGGGTVRRDRLPKASDILADRLRARILGDGLRPGETLPSEADLIDAYGFSRGTVREALRLLESDGLIEIRRGPKGGIKVRHPDVSQIGRSLTLLLTVTKTTTRAFMDFRKLIEPAAAAAAARTASPEQQQWLLDIAEDLPEVSSGLRRTVEFHEALGACSNNEILRMMIAVLGQGVAWHAPREQLSDEDLEHTRRAHRKIARAIAMRDADGAETAMLRHLDRFERVLEARRRLDQPVIPREWWHSRL